MVFAGPPPNGEVVAYARAAGEDLIAGICLCAAAQKNGSDAKNAFQRLVALDPDWKTPAYLTALRGWTQAELQELEKIRQTLYPGK